MTRPRIRTGETRRAPARPLRRSTQRRLRQQRTAEADGGLGQRWPGVVPGAVKPNRGLRSAL